MSVVIIEALRTPIGKFKGSLADIPAEHLGSIVIKAVLERSGCHPNLIDEVMMGNVLQAGQGQGPARQAALHAGLPIEVPATSINQICGSGMKAVMQAAALIESGQNDVLIAGGMENMSASPFLLSRKEEENFTDKSKWADSLVLDALTDAFDHSHMGVTAERLAKKYGISRQDQDAFSVRSQQKAVCAIEQQRFCEEIVSVPLSTEKEKGKRFSQDEYPRLGVTLESLSELKPAFFDGGTVTAGNASGINDGAAALLMMSSSKARETGLRPIASIVAAKNTGVEPSLMGIGPVSAIKSVLASAELSLDDIGLIELNEAFAAQSLAVCSELGLDEEKLNVNGGAIALGHPVGASGARILVSLIHEMKKRKVRYGLASLCIGGGMGVAMIVENSCLPLD